MRTTQPAGYAKLNRNNRIAKGAQAIYVGGMNVNVVSGRPLSNIMDTIMVGGINRQVPIEATSKGQAFSFYKDGWAQTEMLPAIGTADFMEFVYVIPFAPFSRGTDGWTFYTGSSTNQIGLGAYGGGDGATRNQVGCVYDWNASQATQMAFGGAAPEAYLYGSTSKPKLIIAMRRQNGMEFWCDGVKTNLVVQTPRFQAASTMLIGSFVPDMYWTTASKILLAGRVLGSFSEEEIKQFSQNPWGIFAEPPRPQFRSIVQSLIARRAIVIIEGVLYQMKDEWVGQGAPYMVLQNGKMVEDYARAGKPIVHVDGRLRELLTGETLII